MAANPRWRHLVHFRFWPKNSPIFQNPKLQIICIISEKTGAFYVLVAILNFSDILNFKGRHQNEKKFF
jgi:hypothetical protein